MQKTKRKALENAGWKVSSVTDFLELTPEESSLIEIRLALSQALQKYRKTKHLTQIDLAKRLGSSQSRVAKMEAADASVSFDLLIRGLLAAGANNTDIARAIGQSSN
jgi:predicted XRE-type DNA-binding protein